MEDRRQRAEHFLGLIPKRVKLIILVAVIILFTFAFPIICNSIGNRFGQTVGTAVGSFQALTEDAPAAYAQGKADGLSAADTKVVIKNQIQEVGKLDVLAATAKLTDKHEYGDKYTALYQLGADVIFSVDLSKARVLSDETNIMIMIPLPEGKMNIDSTKTRLIDYVGKVLFNGKTEDGIDAYVNSLKQIQENATEQIDDYEYLLSQAKESAKSQVLSLARMASAGVTNITVAFEVEGEAQ